MLFCGGDRPVGTYRPLSFGEEHPGSQSAEVEAAAERNVEDVGPRSIIAAAEMARCHDSQT